MTIFSKPRSAKSTGDLPGLPSDPTVVRRCASLPDLAQRPVEGDERTRDARRNDPHRGDPVASQSAEREFAEHQAYSAFEWLRAGLLERYGQGEIFGSEDDGSARARAEILAEIASVQLASGKTMKNEAEVEHGS